MAPQKRGVLCCLVGFVRLLLAKKCEITRNEEDFLFWNFKDFGDFRVSFVK